MIQETTWYIFGMLRLDTGLIFAFSRCVLVSHIIERRLNEHLWNLYDLKIGLDFVNDDAYPSVCISRPSHEGFSHICLSSTKRSGGVVRLGILSDVNSFKSRVVLDIWPFISDVVYMKLKNCFNLGCASEGLYRMSDRFYQVEESHFSQEFYNASLMNCLKEPFDIYIVLSLRAVSTAFANITKSK